MSQHRRSKKTEKIEVRLSPETKQAFHETCEARNESASSVIRRLIEDYVARFHVPGLGKPLEAVGKTPVWARWMAAMAASVGVASLALLPSSAESHWEESYKRTYNDVDEDGQVTLEEFLAWEESKLRESGEVDWVPIPLEAKRKQHEEYVAALTPFDKNQDFVLRGEEKSAYQIDVQTGMFDDPDGNADGILTVDEYIAYRFKLDAAKEIASPEQFLPARDLEHEKAVAVFKNEFVSFFDFDNDKRVFRDEFLQRWSRTFRRSTAPEDTMEIPKEFELELFDSDQDGLLSFEEFVLKRQADWTESFTKYDINDDSILTEREYVATKSSERWALQERSFRSLDQNQDNKIAPLELHSPESLKDFAEFVLGGCYQFTDDELFEGMIARYDDPGDIQRMKEIRQRQFKHAHCNPEFTDIDVAYEQARKFYQNDSDGDGYLSLEEYAAYTTAH